MTVFFRSGLFSAVILLTGSVVGLLLPNPSISSPVSMNLHSQPEFSYILQNNLHVTIEAAFPPLGLSILFINGLSLSRQILLFHTEGYQLPLLAAAVLPHTVFEFSGFCFAGGTGFAFLHRAIAFMRGTVDTLIDRSFVKSATSTLVLSMALIVFAAVIETYVTSAIVSLFI